MQNISLAPLMILFTRCASLSIGLLMAACVSSPNSAPSYSSRSESPRPRAETVRITPSRVGGIAPGTAFSARALTAAMPGFDVRPIMIANEGGSLSALGMFQSGRQMLQVVGGPDGRVTQVFGVSPYVSGPNGEKIGMGLAEVGLGPGSCRVGTGNWRGMPICHASGTGNIDLVFSIPGYEASGEMPPPDALQAATLQRILWHP